MVQPRGASFVPQWRRVSARKRRPRETRRSAESGGRRAQAHPRAAQQRVLEGVPHPCGVLPLELAVTRGWDAHVVGRVRDAHAAAARTLDPIRVPAAILKKAFAPPAPPKAEASKSSGGGKGAPKHVEGRNALGGPEVCTHDVKGSVVATLALQGWKKEQAPSTPRGMRWIRKAAEACRPKPRLDVLMLLDDVNAV